MFFRDAKIVISCLLEKKNLLDEVDSKLLSISYWERVFLKPRSKLSQKCNNNFLCLVLQGPHEERPVGSFRLRPVPTISAVVRILWHSRAPDCVSQLGKQKENHWQRESWKKLTMWNMATWKARKESLPTNDWTLKGGYCGVERHHGEQRRCWSGRRDGLLTNAYQRWATWNKIKFGLERSASWLLIRVMVSKHCQRHNGPEGWVHITNSYTNLD